MDDWLTIDENLERWESTTKGTALSASDRRVLLANWYYKATSVNGMLCESLFPPQLLRVLMNEVRKLARLVRISKFRIPAGILHGNSRQV